MKRVSDRRRVILALLLLLLTLSLAAIDIRSADDMRSVDSSVSSVQRPSRQLNSLTQISSNQGQTSLAAGQVSNSSSNTITASIEPCMNQVMKKIESRCDSVCFLSKLRARNSLTAEFFDDGWSKLTDQVPVAEQRTEAGKFFWALGKAGLLTANFGISKNESLGAELLDRLIEDDPENAAYYIFATTLALRRGLRSAAHKYNRNMVSSATRYESFFQNISRNIFRESLIEPEDYFVAIEMRTLVPLPDFFAVKELILKDPDIDPSHISKWLMQEGLSSNGAFMDSHWSPLEYAIGLGLLNAVNPDAGYAAPSLKTLFSHPDAYEFDKLLNPKVDLDDCDVERTLQVQLDLLQNVKSKAFID